MASLAICGVFVSVRQYLLRLSIFSSYTYLRLHTVELLLVHLILALARFVHLFLAVAHPAFPPTPRLGFGMVEAGVTIPAIRS